MVIKKFIISFLAISIASLSSLSEVNAQIKLSKEEESELSAHIKNKLDEFQDYLGIIASGKTSPEVKTTAVKSALSLCLCNGEPFYETNGKYNSGVKMQTSGRAGVNRPQLMKTYLNRLKGMTDGRYSDIVIEASDAVKVGDLFPANDGSGRYVTVVQIFQHFVGYSESGFVLYEDYTCKSVKVYIDKVTVPIPGGEEESFIVMLGDTVVKETWY